MQGRRNQSKTGCADYLEAKKVGAQNFYFHYLKLKKWVRSCALCALGSAAPVSVSQGAQEPQSNKVSIKITLIFIFKNCMSNCLKSYFLKLILPLKMALTVKRQ